MSPSPSIPFYVKAVLLIIGFFFFGYFLFLAQGIIVPLIYALIFAILLRPPVRWLIKIKVPRVLAIFITLIIATSVLVSIGILLVSQAKHFGESLPMLVNKLQELLKQVAGWSTGFFKIDPEEIESGLADIKYNIIQNSSEFIGGTISITGRVLAIIILIPVYVFMILFYHPLFMGFIDKISGKNNIRVNEILANTKKVIQRYLIGIMIEASIIAAISSLGLALIGIEYALFLGIISALLNIIPYVGVFIATVLSMTIAFITKESSWEAVYVLILYVSIQVVDNNFLYPKIVGGSASINAIVSILVVIAGGTLWGIAGMFISIPIIAIIKVICDSVDTLKPYGFLLGDMPRKRKIKHVKK